MVLFAEGFVKIAGMWQRSKLPTRKFEELP